MNAIAPTTTSNLPGVSQAGDAIWTRLWQHAPSVEKDEAVLARERRGPRWKWMRSELHHAFGSLAGLKTIELGSGRGDLSVLLAEEGAEVTLLDVNTLALASATERFARLGLRATPVQCDLRAARGVAHAPFDVALSIGVIEHFSGQARTDVLRAHYEALRPGGVAVVSVPHSWCVPYRLWKAYLELRGWWPYGMEIPYSRAEMSRRAHDAGFCDIQLRCLGFRHSLGEHWVKRLTGRRPDWTDTSSPLDCVMGLSLVMIARKRLQ